MNPLLVRFDGEPSLIAPEMRARVEAALAAVVASERGPEILSAHAAAEDGFWPEPGSWKAAFRPYVVQAGILQVPVKGVLLNDFPYAFGSFATGYAYIRRAFDRGLADEAVKGVALLCDSPGGEVAGNFDLADRIFACRGTKPVRAFAHEAAYSAAYSLASAADRIVISRSGGVGSIGVVTAHRDVSKALAEAGITITLIYAGEHKADGNPFEPLPTAVRARFQARIETLYAEFVAIVARHRGLTDAAVRATKALTYSAQDAIAAGLADEVGSLDDAVAAFAAAIIPSTDDEETMSTIDQATHDAAVASARQEGAAAARQEGVTAGSEAATARCGAILGSEHAKGRESLANHLAFKTAMSAEDAVATLQASPAPVSASAGPRLDAIVPDPQVSAGSGTVAGAPDASAGLQAAVDRMIAGLPKA